MKNFFLLLLLFVCVSANGQQNIIQINQSNGSTTTSTNQSDCSFKINGICSSEDIGGVSFESIDRVADSDYVWSNGTTTAYLKNYNNFTVTVLMRLVFDSTRKIGDNGTIMDEVYQVVIQPNETKGIVLKHCNCPSCYSLDGMIVRRLRN